MSTRYLMIEDRNMPYQEVSGTFSTSFEVVDGILRTFWKGEEGAMSVEVGDFLHLSCGGGLPVVSPVKAPRKKADVVCWLLGFAKPLRVRSVSALEELLKKQRSANEWWNFEEWSYAGDGYRFVRCNRSDCGGYYDEAAYIDSRVNVDKEFVIKVLSTPGLTVVYPQAFSQRVLIDRFGFSAEDFATVSQNNPDMWKN